MRVTLADKYGMGYTVESQDWLEVLTNADPSMVHAIVEDEGETIQLHFFKGAWRIC